MRTFSKTTVAPIVALTLAALPGVAVAAESAPTADSLKAVAEAFVSASPSDSVLAGLPDEDLVTASVRCIGLENRTYCLHVGWVEQTPTAGQLRAVVIAQASEAKTATSVPSQFWADS